MIKEIGIIEKINKGHSAVKFMGLQLLGARNDELYITKFYEPTLRNLFKIKQLGIYDVATPTIFKERDIVMATIDNKRIVSIKKMGVLTPRDMLIHDLRGTGAIVASIILILLAIIAGQTMGLI